jgi:hypothetical protein
MEPEGSLPYSQVPATCPYPEPTPSSLQSTIKLYRIYVCYTNMTLYIAFGIIHSRGRAWNLLPVDTGAHLYYQKFYPETWREDAPSKTKEQMDVDQTQPTFTLFPQQHARTDN